MQRTAWIVLFTLFVVATIWLIARPRTVMVSSATIDVGAVQDVIVEVGKTRLPRTHIVAMPIDGRILPIELEVGDRVEAGQRIASLEALDHQTRVAQAQARVRRLRGQIAQNDDTRLEETSISGVTEYLHSVDRTTEAAAAQLQASKARLDDARAQLARVTVLFREGAAAQQELDEVRLYEIESAVGLRTDELTLRAVEAIRAAFRILPHYIRQQMELKATSREPLEAELAEAMVVLEQAERDLARCNILAPISGVVLARLEASERMLPAGTALLEIGDLDELEIETELLSQDASRLQAGMRVWIKGLAMGENPLESTIDRIEPRGFTKVSSLGVEQQRVRVIVALPTAVRTELERRDRAIGVGYRVDVHVIVRDQPRAVRCPRAALFRGDHGEWAVFRIVNGRATLTRIEVGLVGNDYVEITNGLNPGDDVVIGPDATVVDGVTVRGELLRE